MGSTGYSQERIMAVFVVTNGRVQRLDLSPFPLTRNDEVLLSGNFLLSSIRVKLLRPELQVLLSFQ
jgi:hypothetical protein